MSWPVPDITAPEIVAKLGGKWRGNGSKCFCPVHKNVNTPSLSVSTGRTGAPVVHCWVGCDGRAVIAELRKRGWWPDSTVERQAATPFIQRERGLTEDETKRRFIARDIWDRAKPIAGTPAAEYLRLRGLDPAGALDLRYAANHKHLSGVKGGALIGALRAGDGEVTAVQRIWVTPHGTKAALDPVKATLGPMVDSAVRLGRVDPGRGVLGVAEGIETALAASILFRVPVWACLGAARLGKVWLQSSVTRVIVFGDNGKVGKAAAYQAARIYRERGLDARVRLPDAPHGDHNDWLLARLTVPSP